MVGRAGTGKTHTLGTLRAVYESAGYTVIGLTPSARAARELNTGSGIPSTTRCFIGVGPLVAWDPTMKAFIIDRCKPRDGGRIAVLPEPVPADGQVLVQIHAAGVNLFVARQPWMPTTYHLAQAGLVLSPTA